MEPWTHATCHMQGKLIPKNLKLSEPKPAPKPQPKASSCGEHVQLFRMVYGRKKGFQAEHLRILHCLCQHGCEPEIFMFPRLFCVCIHLEMWAEVKVHPYHVRAHVCVGRGV